MLLYKASPLASSENLSRLVMRQKGESRQFTEIIRSLLRDVILQIHGWLIFMLAMGWTFISPVNDLPGQQVGMVLYYIFISMHDFLLKSKIHFVLIPNWKTGYWRNGLKCWNLHSYLQAWVTEHGTPSFSSPSLWGVWVIIMKCIAYLQTDI